MPSTPYLQLMSFLNNLKNAKTSQDIAILLGYKSTSLTYVIYKKPIKYISFDIPKKSGGIRTISAPCPELKLLQRRLSDGLQSCWEEINARKRIARPISHGFRRGTSIISNAAAHRSHRFVFNVDIKDFFGSINFGRVYGFFQKNTDFGLSKEIAKILATIACHEGALPQGSPCSPVISNLIGQILDVRLAKLAKKYGCTYSRDADDLTFSTNLRDFPPEIALLGADHAWEAGITLRHIISKCGFELNVAKTRMQYHDSRQQVTGLVVNQRINVASEYRRLVRAMTHRLITKGKFEVTKVRKNAFGVDRPTKIDGEIDHLQGMYGFIDWIDLKCRRVAGLTPSSTAKMYERFLMYRDFLANSKPIILCEGKTDKVYLQGAIRRLCPKHPKLISMDSAGRYRYKVKFFNFSYTSQRILDLSGGADAVKSFIIRYIDAIKSADTAINKNPLIVLLDNDQARKGFFSLIKEKGRLVKAVDGMEDYYHLAANIYIVFTPINTPTEQTCIENFFDPALLKQVLNGKTFNPVEKTFDESSQYGKAVFASKIVRPNIAKIDFDRFKPILDRIEMAIEAHSKKVAAAT